MTSFKIMNKKQIKRILGALENQWGFKEDLDYAFLVNDKGKIYIANKEVFDIDMSKLRVNSIGMYFGEMKDGLRLSIEGSQLIGPKSSKNIVELDDKQTKEWQSGLDLDYEAEYGFVLIKHNNDFLGSGKSTKDGRILNYVPKTRRIS